jgi:hypothetical protein
MASVVEPYRMSSERSRAMDRRAIESFVGRRGTGVLALASGDAPYATPVSYGFDPPAATFYLRLGVDADSRKRAFLDAPTAACLVVYGERDGDWHSVVARGSLASVAEADVDAAVAEALRRAEAPLLDIWDDPAEDVDFRVFRLPADELTGRTTAGTRGGADPGDGDAT